MKISELRHQYSLRYEALKIYQYQGQGHQTSFSQGFCGIICRPLLASLSSELELDYFFDKMKETSENPELKELFWNDGLTVEYARSLLERLGNKYGQRRKDEDNMRGKVRSVGRLLVQLNLKSSKAEPLTTYLTGQTFQDVADAVETV